MRRRMQVRVSGRALCALLLMSTFVLRPEVRADEPMLALRLTGGQSTVYALGYATRIEFEGEETLWS